MYVPTTLTLDLDPLQAKLLLTSLDHRSKIINRYSGSRIEEDGTKTMIYSLEYLACMNLLVRLSDWLHSQEDSPACPEDTVVES